jgi:hypothetical protein
MDSAILTALAGVLGSLVGGSATGRDRLDYPEDSQ